jgi:phosphoglycerate dehydrogenase-like enzyme
MNVIVVADESAISHLLAPADRERLEKLAQVTWRPSLGLNASEAAYTEALRASCAEVIVSGWGAPKLTRRVCASVPTLKAMIHMTGELRKQVDRACIEDGLWVTNWGDVPARSVAEAALMMTLASLRRTAYWHEEMHHAGGWKDNPRERALWTPQGLFDRTLGLYGFGAVARHFIDLIRPFELTPLVYDPWLQPEDESRYGIRRVHTLEQLFERCDLISIHAGLTSETTGSVNADRLGRMRDGGHIINTARGKIVDEPALLAELRARRLFAALDVYAQEPLPPEHPFRGLRNCLLFPHQAGPTSDYATRCGKTAVDQVERLIRGEPLLYPITVERYDRMT